jgi:hypothetical protein
MFLTKNFCYLEMMRSGSTHIHKLFKKYVDEGKQIGHHGPASREIINSDRVFVGSIRNPWSWYLSVWSFGCENGGHLHYRLTQKKIYFDQLGLNIKPQLFLFVFLQQFFKPLQKWRTLFSDSDNKENFREFLKLLLSNKRIYDVGDGYAFSPINTYAGLMTYYYFFLHTDHKNLIFTKHVNTYEKLQIFDKKYNLLKFVIKNENLEQDFFNFLKKMNIEVSENEKNKVLLADKTSVSQKKNNLDYYYDKETMKLVLEKERFLIEKYNYNYTI